MNDKGGGRLGPREEWPPAPRIAADLCATSPLPTCVLWGEEHLVAVYNEGFAQALALSQPSYGQPVRDLWPPAWPDLGPTLTRVLRHGEATTLDHLTSEGGEASFQAICTPLRDQGMARGVHLTLWKTTQEVANPQHRQRSVGQTNVSYCCSGRRCKRPRRLSPCCAARNTALSWPTRPTRPWRRT